MAVKLENKVAIVTGGARGIGNATCRALALEGAAIIVTDVIVEEGEALAASLADDGHKAVFRRQDVTSEVEWDEIFAAENARSPETRLTELVPARANLSFRGFSAVRVDPARLEPERFDYAQVRPASNWNPTPGLYTRYGDVRELLAAVDDRFVIMGSGDELRLAFPAGALPALAPGWRRDFLIYVDGWAKDADANTAFGGSVEPLPFHAMRGYPYGAGEHYPDDLVHHQYQREYNTRPALRLVRPLVATK